MLQFQRVCGGEDEVIINNNSNNNYNNNKIICCSSSECVAGKTKFAGCHSISANMLR